MFNCILFFENVAEINVSEFCFLINSNFIYVSL